MNQVSDKEIYDSLRKCLDYLKLFYNEYQLFGIAVFGYANYGIADDISELKFQAFYIPTIEEMLTKDYSQNREIVYENFTIQVKDLRNVYNATRFQDIEMIESIYTPYYIVNPKFAFIFDTYFREKAENISLPARRERLRLSATKALQELEKGNKKGFAYAYLFCKKYSLKGIPFNDAWLINTIEERKFIQDYIEDKISYDKVQEAIEYMTELAKVENKIDGDNLDLKTAIVSIYKTSLEQTDSSFTFIKELTDAERLALKKLTAQVGEDGILSIVNFSKTSGISRAVITNLLEKLSRYNIAVVHNLGSRGTRIQFIDSIVFNI